MLLDISTYTTIGDYSKSSVPNAMVDLFRPRFCSYRFPSSNSFPQLIELDDAPIEHSDSASDGSHHSSRVGLRADFGELAPIDEGTFRPRDQPWSFGALLTIYKPTSDHYMRAMCQLLYPAGLAHYVAYCSYVLCFSHQSVIETTDFPTFWGLDAFIPLFVGSSYTFASFESYVDSFSQSTFDGDIQVHSEIIHGVQSCDFYIVQRSPTATRAYLVGLGEAVDWDGYHVVTVASLHCERRIDFIDAAELFNTLYDHRTDPDVFYCCPVDRDPATTFYPQSGVSHSRPTLCRRPGGGDSPVRTKREACFPTISFSPDENERKKEKAAVIKYRRSAKERKNINVFRPQGLSDFFKAQVSLDSDAQDTIDHATSTAEEFTRHMPEIKQALEAISTSGIQVNVTLDTSVAHVPGVIGLISLAYMARTEGGRWTGALAAYGVTYATACAYTHRAWLLERFTRAFAKMEDVRPQSCDSDLIEDLAGAFCGYIALISAKAHKATPDRIASAMKSFASFDRQKLGLANAVAFATRLVEKIVNWFRDHILGLPRISLLESSIPELRSWTNKVDVVMEEAHKGTLHINTANASRLHALVMEGNQLSSKKFNASDSMQVRSALSVYLNALRKLVLPFDQANFTGNGARMEPLVVLLSGAPGVGKTWVLLPLIMDILQRVLPEERLSALKTDFNNEIFSRVPETKYWEGYRGQEACIFDDFGQCRDVAGMPDNENLELIRAANIFPYILHMAGIDAKGCTNFTSRLIFCTTNLKSFKPESIIEPKAVMRRFDLILSVYPKPEFCVDPEAQREARVLDRTKAGDRFDENIYEFCVKKAEGIQIGNDVIETLSFPELRDRIVSMYKKRAIVADNYVSDLAARAQDLLKTQKFEPQGGESSVQMEELSAFDSAFDASVTPDCSNSTLEELLAEDPEADNSIQDQWQLYDVMRRTEGFSYEDFTRYMMKNGYGSRLHVVTFSYLAYKRHPNAFMECLEKMPNKLPVLVRKLAPFDGPLSATVSSSSLSALKMAKKTLLDYWSKLPTLFGEVRKRWSWLEDWQKAFVIGFMLNLAFRFVRHHYGGTEPVECESGGPRDKAPKFSVKKFKVDAVRSEGGVDKNAQDMTTKVLVKSTYEMTIPAFDGQRLGYCTFIKGNIAIMPLHFIAQIKYFIKEAVDRTDHVQFTNLVSSANRKITLGDILDGYVEDPVFAKRDLCLVVLPLHQHIDISSYFISEKQLTFSQIPGALFSTFSAPEVGVRSSYAVCKREKQQYVECDQGDYLVQDILKYNMPTSPGDCGALVVAQSPGFGPGKFLGFHVAGSQTMIGFAAILTTESLALALEKCPKAYPPPSDGAVFTPQCAEFPVPGHFTVYKKLPVGVFSPNRSRIAPSALHNLWTESPYDIPRMRPFESNGVRLDPLAMAIERYGRTPLTIDGSCMGIAADFVGSEILRATSDSEVPPPRLLTFEEAVLGIPEEKYCRSIPRGTSAGFPHVLDQLPGHRGKEKFFGKGQDFDLDRKEAQDLKLECENIIALARKGQRSEVVYLDFLKDETRKHKRVREGNTRLISAAPIAYTIVCRMYFLSFVMAIMAVNLVAGIGVGINCYSEDWDYLAKALRSKGNNILAGDFTGFDTCHYELLANFVLKVIETWYNGLEPEVRKVLFFDLTNSVHVFRDLLYQWCLGRLPSGHPLTAIFSSLMNRILYITCWCMLHPHGPAGITDFGKHVYFVTYGDDSIVSVSDWAIVWFNYHTISAAMKSLGYDYTDEMKSTDDQGPLARSLTDVTFLKRGFRFEAALGRWVAPLQLNAILEMLYWTKAGSLGEEITRTNVDNALRELSLHEEPTFDLWAPRVIAASRDLLSHYPDLQDYRTLQKVTTNLEVVW